MKKIVKKNYKIIIGIIIGLMISSVGVYAVNTLAGNEVSYNHDKSGLTSDTVQGAIDELYDKVTEKPQITAYTYNEDKGSDYCVNGEERTCKKTDCYTKNEVNSCPQGTIIKYYVRENEYHYFYVLHDDGDKITMQQRENTVRNIPWNEENDSTQGPVTILKALEQATSTWTNVNIIKYTPGETEFNGNKFTGCTWTASINSDYTIRCESNKYDSTTLGTTNARARMITAQEAGSTGCLVWKDGSQDDRILGNSKNANNVGSCPDWMHNYLHNSQEFDGSYNDDTVNENNNHNWRYWTMSASSDTVNGAWLVYSGGYLGGIETLLTSTDGGVRAVVEINKE